MKTCPYHGQPILDFLGCWKCLADERDPHNNLTPSWWWHSEAPAPGPATILIFEGPPCPDGDDGRPWLDFRKAS